MNADDRLERLGWARRDIIEEINVLEGCREKLAMDYELPAAIPEKLSAVQKDLDAALGDLVDALISAELFLRDARIRSPKEVPLKNYLPEE